MSCARSNSKARRPKLSQINANLSTTPDFQYKFRSSLLEQQCPSTFSLSSKMRLFFKLFAVLAIMAALSATNVPSAVGVWARTPGRAPPSPTPSALRGRVKPINPAPSPPPPAEMGRVRPLRSPLPPPSPNRQRSVGSTQFPPPPSRCH
ncbi:hypothetical protein ZWY2020_042328 [Hordeum vulgare]|nr:hypothetical protein ZWY2020_042328 [Hordeum vulgare]